MHMAETDSMVRTWLASDEAAEHYAKTMPPPKPIGPVEPLPVLDPAYLNRRLDELSRFNLSLHDETATKSTSAEQLWEALAAEWASEGGLNKDRAIAIMRSHGLR